VLYNEFSNWYDKLDSLTEIEFLGQILYTHYVLQFLIGGFILFLAVIGAVVLTINFSKQRVNSQIVSKQLSRIYQNSIHY
jgi:NADH-quinone oxidoreductase subunit J